MNIYYEQDADLALIQGKKVVVIGYGSQGHAHALNLKDNGVEVRVGLQATSGSKPKAEAEGLTVISHLDGKRLITVTANTVEGVTTPVAANADIAKAGRSVEDKYPKYKIAFGGQNRDTEESLDSLFRAFIVAILIIYMILSSLFRSLLQPFVVLMAVPFALTGVFLAFLGHGEPLSFLAFMGIIGLSGVVVNDSLILVEFYNHERERGVGVFESLLAAGRA